MTTHVLTRTVDLAKVWGRVCSRGSMPLVRSASRLRSAADLSRIDRLAAEMRPVYETDPASAAKYADHTYWIPFNVERVGRLGLHRTASKRILDIGCGPGYFLAAARACGHDCRGIDAPDTVLSAVEQRVYTEMLASLGLSDVVTPLLIERFQPMTLPVSGFDLITAFWICFNRHRQPDEWGPEEWRFFIDDARNHLRPGGVLHLELNAHPERYGSLRFYDEPTLALFRSAGTVEGNIVRISK